MPPRPRIHLTLDTPLLSLASHDTLVLSRKVNGTFSTALAVASPNPRPSTSTGTTHPASQLYAQNIFAWDNTFRVAVSYSHSASPFLENGGSGAGGGGGGGGSGALIASVTNAVEIGHGQTARFNRNMLMPAVSNAASAADGVVVGVGGLALKDGGGSGGGRCVFSVTDVPPSCRVEVMQSVGAQRRPVRVFQSEEGGLNRAVEVSVENEFILFWTERQVPLGGRVVVSDQEGCRMTIGEDDEVAFVRYGFATPNQPRGDEAPVWHRQVSGSLPVDDSTYSLVRITM